MLKETRGWVRVTIAIAAAGVALAGVFAVWRGMKRFPVAPAWTVDGGNPERGRAVIRDYGCGSCHAVPGVRGAVGRVGPRLDDFANQIYIAGRVPNVPENLVSWIENPRATDPRTVMPDLGVTKQDARDIASYLYTLR